MIFFKQIKFIFVKLLFLRIVFNLLVHPVLFWSAGMVGVAFGKFVTGDNELWTPQL